MYRKIDLKLIVCVLLVTTLFSCQTGKNKTVVLYNADSLITTQVDYLSEHKARLHKVTRLGEKESEAATVPGSLKGWENELDIFRQLESINKPVNRRLYAVERSSDVKSNLVVKSFIGHPEPGEKEVEMPVKYLKIFYQNTPDNIRKIEAQYDESNTLYTGSRFLKMEFQQVHNKTVLTSYSITGAQKMFMGDSVSYNISAFVTIPN